MVLAVTGGGVDARLVNAEGVDPRGGRAGARGFALGCALRDGGLFGGGEADPRPSCTAARP